MHRLSIEAHSHQELIEQKVKNANDQLMRRIETVKATQQSKMSSANKVLQENQ